MKKKIWFVVGAVLVLIIIVLLCAHKSRSEAQPSPTLPSIGEAPNPSVPMLDTSQNDTRQTISHATEPSAHQSTAGTQSDPEQAENTQTIPYFHPGFQTNDSEYNSETAPDGTIPSDSSWNKETESSSYHEIEAPAETDSNGGFPILPPDIFP